ncbi:CheR family methyltransferase [Desulfoluna spongiiphila]|uniref:Chemotaxis protein methyltransferase CheR n=1 Tax=Desulfoluna spongiiphila TaxID=419481 RepID=A0A1G5H1C4_9BACT|nr:protein-glutamate O-methyltransferase CheR [Desulfoluna spongiiphila]SCY57672.1 chemotaxis protein methyltransferase CheR [Desulfoluna spongiiphila]VVS94726.1 mcp methyltransferase cher-type [Desulfoluna spongiiphila]
MAPAQPLTENDAIEMDCLLYAIHRKYGYDFQQYAQGSLHRRLKGRLERSGLTCFSEMQYRILNDRAFFEIVLADLSINVTEMFRDPHFFKAVREHVVPKLAARPFVRVWVAGCATGEEAYSMAILLQEEGLAGRFRIYATDFNERVLHTAREGIYPIESIRTYTRNHLLSGGCGCLVDHYTARYDNVIMNRALKEAIRFSDHNLVSDSHFGEMDLILCRNVLIYFSPPLRNRVIGTFFDSLAPDGFFCLGTGESMNITSWADRVTRAVPKEKIYQKKETPSPSGPCCDTVIPSADEPVPPGVMTP